MWRAGTILLLLAGTSFAVRVEDDDDSLLANDAEGSTYKLQPGPSTAQIRWCTKTAKCAVSTYSVFSAGTAAASWAGIVALAIDKGIELYRQQLVIDTFRDASCKDFMKKDFHADMLYVVNDIIGPALDSQNDGCMVSGALNPNLSPKCSELVEIAQGWSTYMNNFLAVLGAIARGPVVCPDVIDDIKTSWNELAEAVVWAQGGHRWNYEFSWSDFMEHPKSEYVPKDCTKLKCALETTLNPFRTTPLERILKVAKKLNVDTI